MFSVCQRCRERRWCNRKGYCTLCWTHIGEKAETIHKQDKEIRRLRTGDARANLFLEDCDPAHAVLMLREAFDSEALARIIELLREGAARSGNADC
jgi:hypothetical protein